MYGYKSCKWLERHRGRRRARPGLLGGLGYDIDAWVGKTNGRHDDTNELTRLRAHHAVRPRRARRCTGPTRRSSSPCSSPGSILYFGPLSALVGRRETIKTIHVLCGLALPDPGAARPAARSRGFRADATATRAARRGRLGVAEVTGTARQGRQVQRRPEAQRHLRRRRHPRDARDRLDHVLVQAVPALVADRRDVRARLGLPRSCSSSSIGHIGKALADPAALKGMISGRVTRGWARRNRPRWLEASSIGKADRPPIE